MIFSITCNCYQVCLILLKKYCKAISSVLLVIMVSVFVPIYADAQDFDKPIAADIDEIITEYPAERCTLLCIGIIMPYSPPNSPKKDWTALLKPMQRLAANEIMDSGLLDPGLPEAGAVDQNGQSAYAPNVTTSDNPVRKDVTTREYEYVKTVSAIYEPDESVTKLHIYRSRVNGSCRASIVSGIWSDKCSWFTIVSDGGYDFGLFSKQVVKMTLSAWLIL